jgi:glycerol kinase
LALFKERKRRIPLNKGFQLLAHLKTPQFSCSIAEVGLATLKRNGMNEKKNVVGVDIGTTNIKAVVFNRKLEVVCSELKALSQHHPAPSWMEQEPEEILKRTIEVIKSCVTQTNVTPKEIASIGISNHTETFLLWNKLTGEPLTKVITWQCRRGEQVCKDLRKEGYEKLIKEKTGLVLDATFSAPKIKWIFDNIRKLDKEARKGRLLFGTLDSWIIWNLTKEKNHVTDVSNASRTLLFNIKNLCWDLELIRIFGICEQILPKVRSSSEIYGHTSKKLLGMEVPISGAVGDQQAALFGNACLEEWTIKSTYGTGCFVWANTGSHPFFSQKGFLTTVAWRIRGQTTYALEGFIITGGSAIQWLKDNLGLIEKIEDVEAVAKKVPNNGGVYFVPAFTGLGSPSWDPTATGCIVGLNRKTTKSHIVRATLEAIAFQTKEVVECMEDVVHRNFPFVRVDGRASKNDLLMQIQANILGKPIERSKVTESSALGSAYLAGLAVGFWENLELIEEAWKKEKTFIPNISRGERERLFKKWTKAVSRARNWTNT